MVGLRADHATDGNTAWTRTGPVVPLPAITIALSEPLRAYDGDTPIYIEGIDDAITVTATAGTAPSDDLIVNVRIASNGFSRFVMDGNNGFDKTITILAGETTGSVDYVIVDDGPGDADTQGRRCGGIHSTRQRLHRFRPADCV